MLQEKEKWNSVENIMLSEVKISGKQTLSAFIYVMNLNQFSWVSKKTNFCTTVGGM